MRHLSEIGDATAVRRVLAAGALLLAFVLTACSKPAAPPPAGAQATASQSSRAAPTEQFLIGVLPLATAADTPAYLGDGIARHLSDALARTPALATIAPASAFRLRDSAELTPQIGQRLGATHLLRGKLTQRGDRLLLDLDFVRAGDGQSLWHETLDRSAAELPGLAELIAARIAAVLKMQRTAGGASPDLPPGGSALAFDALLKGEWAMQRGDPAAQQAALGFFANAIAIDPRWGRPHAMQALVRLRQLALRDAAAGPVEALRERARLDTEAALRLDPSDPLAHRVRALWLGDVALDAVSAEQEIRSGLALQPDDPALLGMLAVRQTGFGQMEAAAATLRQALRRDPLSASMLYQMGYVELALVDYSQAEAALRRARDLEPRLPLVHAFLAVALFQQNRTQEAIDAARSEPLPLWRDYALAMAYWAAGDRPDSEAALQSLIRDHGRDAPTQIAGIYAQRDDREALFHWLDVARRSGDPGIVEIRYMPFLARYADDPRFKAILRELDIAGSGASPDK
ncbi:tetratricopeptide repeat protein [Thermomonas sp.]|uniref:tetratricopeptide repeat protein n=1 Tax=Thermomonas sp. TaxID=1971895 RepID=UPI002C75EB81|nr:tetratricopeptide repeat protein [Thermomonas sp.]HRO63946.1 tetratricopeptide repeat protein [Thermomonas sp.]